jgi:V-type H+-transporting ATPase subunit H
MPVNEQLPLIPKVQSTASRVKQGALTNEDVLRLDMPWKSFCTAGIITKEQLEMLYQLDKQPIETQVAKFEQRGTALVDLMKDLLAGVNKDEVIQYVLALLDELLTASPNLARFFALLLADSKGYTDPFGPLMKLLMSSSLYILEKATVLLAKVLSYKLPIGVTIDAHAEQVMTRQLCTFTEWVMHVLSKDPTDTPPPIIQYALNALLLLASVNKGREACIQANGLPVLCAMMGGGPPSSSGALQLLYQVLFALWSISYFPAGAMEMVTSRLGVVPKLIDIVKTVPKEKVVRVALATLRNLLGTGSASSDMVAAGVMKVLTTLQTRKFADEDIMDDVEFLIAALQVNVQTMSSWDVYKKEVESGKLEWTPSHKSENFWKDNYKFFEQNSFDTLKRLIALLTATDPQTLAIACHDISEFVKYHPEGRRLMTQFGAKQPAMAILKHSDPEVQKYALTCVQRLMVINWEYMSKAG